MKLGKITPILRIFDEAKAKEFYVDFLGFKVDWEHRFADDLPLYMGISKGDCVLHLSEPFGDCCPGAALRIETDDVEIQVRDGKLPTTIGHNRMQTFRLFLKAANKN